MNNKRLPFVLAWVIFVCTSCVLFFTNERAFFFFMKAMLMVALALAPVAYFFWKDGRPQAQEGQHHD
jgi:hypothetical protein